MKGIQHQSFREGPRPGSGAELGFPLLWSWPSAGPGFVHWGPKLRGPPAGDLPSFFHKPIWTSKCFFNLGVMEGFKSQDSKDRNQKGKD